MANGGDGRMDGRTDCVLQDIGPLGPLPKKDGGKGVVYVTIRCCNPALPPTGSSSGVEWNLPSRNRYSEIRPFDDSLRDIS